MGITDIVNTELIDFHPRSRSKSEAIKEMAEMLKRHSKIDNTESFIEEVYERETISSTNTGIGVAIPHGKGPSVLQTSVAICRFDEGILWDDESVRIVILLAVVDNEEGTAHLEVISRISTMLMDDDFLELLFTTASEEALFQEILFRLKEET